MTEAELAIGAPPPAERNENSVGAIARRRWESWKAGDVGVMPVVIGLIIIVAFFYSQNSNFLTAGNFTNLMVQMAGVTTIAIGVVFVLLLGEIDLSIGYVSGIAGVVVAKLQLPDGSWEVKGVAAIVIAVIVTALIGLFQLCLLRAGPSATHRTGDWVTQQARNLLAGAEGQAERCLLLRDRTPHSPDHLTPCSPARACG